MSSARYGYRVGYCGYDSIGYDSTQDRAKGIRTPWLTAARRSSLQHILRRCYVTSRVRPIGFPSLGERCSSGTYPGSSPATSQTAMPLGRRGKFNGEGRLQKDFPACFRATAQFQSGGSVAKRRHSCKAAAQFQSGGRSPVL